MQFVKMQALGNDYVYIDCFKQTVNSPGKLAGILSDRNTGIGSDGLILIRPSDRAACKMEMYNPDGTRSAMCGNGMRCVARYAYEEGYCGDTQFEIETDMGLHKQRINLSCGQVRNVTSAIGRPKFERPDIPMKGQGRALDYPLQLGRRQVIASSLSVGNPHTIIFVDELDRYPCKLIGPEVEVHPDFPERTNVEFVQRLAIDQLAMEVWERGTGMTLACGSGAVAAVCAAVETGRTGRKVTVRMPMGPLEVEYPEDGEALLTGPAEKVFEGRWLGRLP